MPPVQVRALERLREPIDGLLQFRRGDLPQDPLRQVVVLAARPDLRQIQAHPIGLDIGDDIEVFDRHGILLDMKADPDHPLKIEYIEPAPPRVAVQSAPVQPGGVAQKEVLQARLVGSRAGAVKVPKPGEPGEESTAEESHWYDEWWVWSLIGGGVMAAAATAAVLATALQPSVDARDVKVIVR